MRYLVTNQISLFESTNYSIINVEESLRILNTLTEVGVDTETQGFDPYTKEILLLQLGNYDIQIAIDTSTINILLYKEFLENKDILFLFQNAKFDLRFFLRKGIIFNKIYDTYLAEKLLWLGALPGTHSASLASMAYNYCKVQLDKSVRGEIHKGLTDRVIVYGCDDVKYLGKIKDEQIFQLQRKGLIKAAKVENQFVKVLAYIEYCGIKLDRDKWQIKIDKDNANLLRTKEALDNWVIEYCINTANNNINLEGSLYYYNPKNLEIALKVPKGYRRCPKYDRCLESGDIEEAYLSRKGVKWVEIDSQGDLFEGFSEKPRCTINWDSAKQVIPLFKHLGFNLETKDKITGNMKNSVEANIISAQLKVSTIASIYLEYKKAAKVCSTYGDNFFKHINPVSGRIHTQFNQLMNTTRLSSGGKDKDTGQDNINFQNIPSDAYTRSCFVAELGNLLIDCDYHAQEDFLFAELSQEPKLIEFYNDTKERDGHSFVAKMCFPSILNDVEEHEVKHLHPNLRKQAKSAKFAIHYGGNGTTIARNLSLPVELGMEIEKSYLEGFPGIAAYFKKVKQEMWDKGYILISSITGHKSFVEGWSELKELEKSFTREFWEKYKLAKTNDTKEFYDYYKPLVRNYFNKKGAAERSALNFPVQGSAAILTKLAGVFFYEELIKRNLLFTVLIPNAVHDEILVEAPKEISEEIAALLQKCMEDAGALFCKSVKLTAVPEIGECWIH